MNFEDLLYTDRFKLEPVTEHHADKLFLSLQDAELYKYIPQNPPCTIEDLFKKYSVWSKRGTDDKSEIWLNYAIFDASDKKYKGTVQATIQKEGRTYIAYETFLPYQKTGVATEACERLIKLLHTEFGIKQIFAHVDTRNIPSQKRLAALGFIQVESIINADFFKGHNSDEYVFMLCDNSGT